jgi:hypothetical protein
MNFFLLKFKMNNWLDQMLLNGHIPGYHLIIMLIGDSFYKYFFD